MPHSYGADLIILFILFALAAAYGFYRSKGRLVSLIISFYPAILLFLNFPYINNIIIFKATPSQVFFSKCLIFLVFLIVIHLIFNRVITSSYDYGGSKRLYQIAVLSLSVLILIIVFLYRIVPLQGVYSATLPVAKYLSSSADFFWWLLVPFIGLFIVK